MKKGWVQVVSIYLEPITSWDLYLKPETKLGPSYKTHTRTQIYLRPKPRPKLQQSAWLWSQIETNLFIPTHNN